MSLSVLVVDDRPEVARVLTYLIETDDRLSLTGLAKDGVDALEHTRQFSPDAIVCDVHMPRMDGIEALPLLRNACPESVIVLYTSEPDAAKAAPALGADEVFDKADDPGLLIELLVGLCEGRNRAGAVA
jgi:CheY-like chemotaxis protein